MNYKQLKIKFNKLRKIHNSTNEAVERLETENRELLRQNNLLEAKNEQLVKQLTIRERITNKSLNRVNEQSDKYLREINRLREVIKNGDND